MIDRSKLRTDVAGRMLDAGLDVSSILRVRSKAVCLDGTACTKKSSILARTGMLVTKVQEHKSYRNMDTVFVPMIGYIIKGKEMASKGEPHLSDRSPLNPLEWHHLWKILDHWQKTYGNVRCDPERPDHKKTLDEYGHYFEALRESYVYQLLRKDVNALVLIDSHPTRCLDLHAVRKEGADEERSKWPQYPALQNLMYKKLYPGAFIDLNGWESVVGTDGVVDGVADLMVALVHAAPTAKGRALEAHDFEMYSVPVCPDMDYLKLNMTIQVDRSLARVECARLADREEKHLGDLVPKWVSYVVEGGADEYYDVPDN